MGADFTIIAITPPLIFDDEADWVRRLLDSGAADRVHLRHPSASSAEMQTLLQQIGTAYHNRISLHDHPELIGGSLGFHFNSRNPWRQLNGTGCRSMSLHCPTELPYPVDYVTLSPVYDSISKPGYHAVPDLDPTVFDVPVIALGGVTPDRYDDLRRRGFAGAAMLGYFTSLFS